MMSLIAEAALFLAAFSRRARGFSASFPGVEASDDADDLVDLDDLSDPALDILKMDQYAGDNKWRTKETEPSANKQ